jgi:hypothetical protein
LDMTRRKIQNAYWKVYGGARDLVLLQTSHPC